MNENKVENPKTEVPKNSDMNNCDYLTDLLITEKNMSVNMTIALNEASNEKLFDELFKIFTSIKNKQREIYELMFQKGWYSLEKAEETKITQKRLELSQKLGELQPKEK